MAGIHAALRCALWAAAAFGVGHGKVVIAVGDSITEGFGSSDPKGPGPKSSGWVSYLSLCTGWAVRNFGVGGTTMQRISDSPYWSTAAYREALTSSPDIVYLMLGTNDARSINWDAIKYKEDALAMVQSFLALPSSPQVYLLAPPPLFNDGFAGMKQDIINYALPAMLAEVASESGPRVRFLDVVFRAFGGSDMTCHECMYSCPWSGDGCHPSDFGHEQIAFALCSATDALCSCPPMDPPGPPWSPHCLTDRRVLLLSTVVPAYCCLLCLWLRRQALLEACHEGHGAAQKGGGSHYEVAHAPASWWAWLPQPCRSNSRFLRMAEVSNEADLRLCEAGR